MEIKVTNYYLRDDGTVTRTENISTIVDKMIRLAAKLTECYASDIVYDIGDLSSAVKENKPLDNLLFFRECGVTTMKVSELNADEYDALLFNFTPIQVWRLTHDPEVTETKLIRVDVRKVGII